MILVIACICALVAVLFNRGESTVFKSQAEAEKETLLSLVMRVSSAEEDEQKSAMLDLEGFDPVDAGVRKAKGVCLSAYQSLFSAKDKSLKAQAFTDSAEKIKSQIAALIDAGQKDEAQLQEKSAKLLDFIQKAKDALSQSMKLESAASSGLEKCHEMLRETE